MPQRKETEAQSSLVLTGRKAHTRKSYSDKFKAGSVENEDMDKNIFHKNMNRAEMLAIRADPRHMIH